MTGDLPTKEGVTDSTLAGRLAQPNFYLPSRPSSRALTLNLDPGRQITRSQIYLPLCPAVTGAPRNRGVLAILCLSCVLGCCFNGCAAWPVRVRALLEGVALACLDLKHLLPFLSLSPFLPTFFHFAVCLSTLQSANTSTCPFSPSPSAFSRLISGISLPLNTIPLSNTLPVAASKQ